MYIVFNMISQENISRALDFILGRSFFFGYWISFLGVVHFSLWVISVSLIQKKGKVR